MPSNPFRNFPFRRSGVYGANDRRQERVLSCTLDEDDYWTVEYKVYVLTNSFTNTDPPPWHRGRFERRSGRQKDNLPRYQELKRVLDAVRESSEWRLANGAPQRIQLVPSSTPSSDGGDGGIQLVCCNKDCCNDKRTWNTELGYPTCIPADRTRSLRHNLTGPCSYIPASNVRNSVDRIRDANGKVGERVLDDGFVLYPAEGVPGGHAFARADGHRPYRLELYIMEDSLFQGTNVAENRISAVDTFAHSTFPWEQFYPFPTDDGDRGFFFLDGCVFRASLFQSIAADLFGFSEGATRNPHELTPAEAQFKSSTNLVLHEIGHWFGLLHPMVGNEEARLRRDTQQNRIRLQAEVDGQTDPVFVRRNGKGRFGFGTFGWCWGQNPRPPGPLVWDSCKNNGDYICDTPCQIGVIDTPRGLAERFESPMRRDPADPLNGFRLEDEAACYVVDGEWRSGQCFVAPLSPYVRTATPITPAFERMRDGDLHVNRMQQTSLWSEQRWTPNQLERMACACKTSVRGGGIVRGFPEAEMEIPTFPFCTPATRP